MQWKRRTQNADGKCAWDYCFASSRQNDGNVCPSQLGILRPGLMLRLMSMRPHWSSQFLPFELYLIFQGSSKAENLFCEVSLPSQSHKSEPNLTYQKYSVLFVILGHTQSSKNRFISLMPATDPPSQVWAAPQFVPPADGQPTSAMTCLMSLLDAVSETSRSSQNFLVQSAASDASTPAKKGCTLDMT